MEARASGNTMGKQSSAHSRCDGVRWGFWGVGWYPDGVKLIAAIWESGNLGIWESVKRGNGAAALSGNLRVCWEMRARRRTSVPDRALSTSGRYLNGLSRVPMRRRGKVLYVFTCQDDLTLDMSHTGYSDRYIILYK